ncbi:MAG TPA: winged helix DNA-binding domain-containing protein [Pyrinomonadaceae bacterium]
MGDVVSQRLDNHKLSSSEFKKPVDVVRWLGAVQAQDYNGAKWALALRMRAATDAAVEEAFNDGHILRTHLLRPTWHFVAPDDIRWLLQLTGARVNVRCGSGYRKYELDNATLKRSNKVLSRALQGGKHLTRSALKQVLNRSGIAADDAVRMAHILIRAELDGVVCSGPRVGKQFTYALLEERVPATKSLTRDESLAKLTQRYFASHGPATLQDFVWWSGLTIADARHGVDLVDRHLRQELIDEKVYLSPRAAKARKSRHSAHLLPAYDEYTVAYKDRQSIYIRTNGKPSITTWGLLGPIVILDGRVVGSWKRTTDKIGLNLPPDLKEPEKSAITQAVDRYEAFLDTQKAQKLA